MGSLPPERQHGLHANLERVKAQKRIQDGKFKPTDYRSVYALFLQAYGDEQIATQAQTESLELLVKESTDTASATRG